MYTRNEIVVPVYENGPSFFLCKEIVRAEDYYCFICNIVTAKFIEDFHAYKVEDIKNFAIILFNNIDDVTFMTRLPNVRIQYFINCIK